MTAAPIDSDPPKRRSFAQQALVLIAFLALVFAVEGATVSVTQPAIDGWYADLTKPTFTPPNLAFPIVWTAIFFLMALAGWQAWRAAQREDFGWPLACFLVQLALNFTWSALFFGAGDIFLALVDVVALILAILATTTAFWQVSRAAGLLMLPYLAWVCFATALNVEILRLNY
ncbi:TspO/MBR family protein [Rhodovibrio salinarum]|uniref:Tryptophan-rich sensory protein n=1 Tax=Rhodovibrio salinarum TaxID=1087 RepID=A0A934QGR8_9PROT|nr:TspO/MBR family protein [Rhodovibrio salinarum]MBK1696260.1 tryptophan-rich sensory protein [Rhodovibrio salinarum]